MVFHIPCTWEQDYVSASLYFLSFPQCLLPSASASLKKRRCVHEARGPRVQGNKVGSLVVGWLWFGWLVGWLVLVSWLVSSRPHQPINQFIN
jgi:hypothetical protein